MTRRFRLLSALVALLALSAFFGESVWASVCPPEMVMEIEGATADSHVGHEAASAHAPSAEHDASASAVDSSAPGSSPSSSHDDPCPLAFAGAGSCASVTLPAESRMEDTTAGISEMQAPAGESLNDILPITSLFRPPRA